LPCAHAWGRLGPFSTPPRSSQERSRPGEGDPALKLRRRRLAAGEISIQEEDEIGEKLDGQPREPVGA